MADIDDGVRFIILNTISLNGSLSAATSMFYLMIEKEKLPLFYYLQLLLESFNFINISFNGKIIINTASNPQTDIIIIAISIKVLELMEK